MTIIERLETVLAGGLDSWPIASMEWEYAEAIKALKQLTAERDRLRGYCETIDKLRAMDQEACNKAWIEIERLRDLLKEARSNLYDMCDAAIVYRIDEALKGQQ